MPTKSVTKGAVKFAQDVAANYKADHWDKGDHDVSAIRKAAGKNGLEDSINWYEDGDFNDVYGGNSADSTWTMARLKEDLIRNLNQMIFGVASGRNVNTAEMYHAQSLLAYPTKDFAPTVYDYFAVTAGLNNNTFMLHYLNIRHGYNIAASDYNTQYHTLIMDPAKFDETVIPTNTSVDTTALRSTVTTAENSLKEVTAKLNNDTAKLKLDKQAMTDATNKYNDIVANRNKDIAKLVGNTDISAQINKLQGQLSILKTNYDNHVKQINSNYQAKLSSLKSDYDAQVSKIKAEPTSIDQAIAKIKVDYQAQLAQLKKNHEAKLAEIQNDAKTKIEALKKQVSENDPEITKLQGQIKTIKDNLAKQQKALDDQFAALKAQDQEEYNALEQKLKNSSSEAAKGNNDHYNTSDGHEVVLPGNDDQKEATTPSDHNSQVISHNNSSQAAAPAGQATSNHATNVTTISYPASQAQVSANVAPMTREAVKAQENGTKLPQTGNENGIVAVALGAMAAMLGLGFAAKKRY